MTEIGGWIDRFSATGRLVWSIKSPTDYPSDAQLLPNGDVLVAGFNTPGGSTSLPPAGAFSATALRAPRPVTRESQTDSTWSRKSLSHRCDGQAAWPCARSERSQRDPNGLLNRVVRGAMSPGP